MTVGELKRALDGYDPDTEVFCDVPYGLLHPGLYEGAYALKDVEEGESSGRTIVFFENQSFEMEDGICTTNKEYNKQQEQPDCPECVGEGYCLTCNGYGYLNWQEN